MKKLLLLFVAFFLFQLTTFAQEGWFWQNPLPQGNALRDIYVFDENTAIAVGNAGTVIKTTDSGTSWNIQHYAGGTTSNLFSVHFTDNNTGWTVGEDGTILKTTDGGTNWNSQSSGTTSYLFSVHFTDNNTGWAVGSESTILKTTDGGINWNSQTSGTTQHLSSVHFTDNDTGWVVGYYGNILKTITGGVVSVELTTAAPADFVLQQNYPNPFNPTTTISFSLTAKDAKNAKIEIYNLKGQKVKTLISDQLPAGEHSVVWDGKDENNKPLPLVSISIN